jgi:glycosyltransferase involved in cell wall biosynthesis
VRVKILIATPYFHPRTGGLETYVWHLAHGLRAAGMDVVVVCGDSVPTVLREEIDGLAVYRLPIGKTIFNTPVDVRWPWLLRRIIRSERPDMINAHAPVVFMIDVAALAAGRRPLVVTYHAATLVKPGSVAMRLITRGYQLVQHLTLWRADVIVAVSPYVRDALARWSRKTAIVSNAAANPGPAVKTVGDGLVFIASLQRTHSWKGLDLVLDALARCGHECGRAPDLTVMGDGEDRPHYEQRAAELGIGSAVTFMGYVPPAERDALLRRARAVVVYPTTANDAFPTVLLDAWAQGLPVVAAAIGAIPSLVRNGHNGILARANDPADLARALAVVLSDGDKAQQMGENGRQLVARELNWPTQVSRMVALLESLRVSPGRRGRPRRLPSA